MLLSRMSIHSFNKNENCRRFVCNTGDVTCAFGRPINGTKNHTFYERVYFCSVHMENLIGKSRKELQQSKQTKQQQQQQQQKKNIDHFNRSKF